MSLAKNNISTLKTVLTQCENHSLKRLKNKTTNVVIISGQRDARQHSVFFKSKFSFSFETKDKGKKMDEVQGCLTDGQ